MPPDKAKCPHSSVTEHVKIYPASQFQPSESAAHYICDECGADLDWWMLDDDCKITEATA
jgi:hypothetical protein